MPAKEFKVGLTTSPGNLNKPAYFACDRRGLGMSGKRCLDMPLIRFLTPVSLGHYGIFTLTPFVAISGHGYEPVLVVPGSILWSCPGTCISRPSLLGP